VKINRRSTVVKINKWSVELGKSKMPSPIRIHFPNLLPDVPAIDLVGALGVGGHTAAHGAPGPAEHKYDHFNLEARNWFLPVDYDDAEVLIFPHNAQNHPHDIEEVSAKAKDRRMGCMFLTWGDADVALPVPYGTVYRHSLSSSRQLRCERAMPAFCADPLDDFGGIVLTREKMLRPTVSFCGFVSNPLMRRIYRLSGRKEKAHGLELRARALRSLCHPDVRTDFICRNSFFGGATGRFHHDVKAQFQVWHEFVNNVLDSDYTICVRGAGNFSYRLYEVLAAGRIPLFINTDCVLPFEDEIDWRKHCVWVEEDELQDAGEILALFHAGLSNEEFIGLQIENRRLWEDRLSPLAFYRQALAKTMAAASAVEVAPLPAVASRRRRFAPARVHSGKPALAGALN
jgi:hypothetical protein